VIGRFARGEDRIDLAAIDADPGRPGNQAFTFIGAAAFSGTAGEVRVTAEGPDTVVQADTGGDGAADFAIALTGRIDLDADDFVF
jgi:hypothetical protein